MTHNFVGQHVSSGCITEKRVHLILVNAIISLLIISCNKEQNNAGSESEIVLDAIVSLVEDGRNIPQDCVTFADCDDGDPCTWDICVDGICTYKHQYLPMVTRLVESDVPILDASVIGNRLYTSVSSAAPEIRIFRIPEEESPDRSDTDSATENESTEQPVEEPLTLLGTVSTTAGAIAVDATWGGFISAEGKDGIAAFSTDNLDAPVYSSATKERVLSNLDTVVNVTVNSSYTYIAGFEEGVTMLSGELDAPEHLGTVDTIGRVVDVAPRGSSALVADSLGGAVSIYLQDDSPVSGTIVPTLGRVVDAHVYRRSAIIAEYGAGFSLIDFSRASEPQRLARVIPQSPVVAVHMLGTQTALVFLESGEVMRVGFLDYHAPVLLESIQLDGTPQVHGVDFDRGLGVITLENGSANLLYNGCAY